MTNPITEPANEAPEAAELPTLTHPDGREYQPTSAQEATRLVTAEGYKLPEGAELPDAFAEGKAKLAERRAAAEALGADVEPADAATAPVNTDDQVADPSGNVAPTGDAPVTGNASTAKAAPAGKNKAAPAGPNKAEGTEGASA